MLLFVVGDGSDPVDQRAGGLERGRQHRAVRLVDLPRTKRLAGRPELGPGTEHDNPRPAAARDLGDSGGGEGADLSSAEHGPGSEQRFTGAHIAPGRPDMGSRVDRIRHLHAVVIFDNILDRHDGVCSGRHRAARGDLHRLSGLQRPLGGYPGGDSKDDRQLSRDVLRPDREAVHRRARERR